MPVPGRGKVSNHLCVCSVVYMEEEAASRALAPEDERLGDIIKKRKNSTPVCSLLHHSILQNMIFSTVNIDIG